MVDNSNAMLYITVISIELNPIKLGCMHAHVRPAKKLIYI